MQRSTLLLLILVLAFSLTALAASPVIGFVQASGDFRLNQAATRGNGTLFDGSVLETGQVRSDVSLKSGGHIALAPNSKSQIFKDRAVLESGAAEVSATGYTLIAAKLSISGPAAQVAVDSPTKIRVGAISTPVEVRNSGNVLIARVNPGTALEFDNQGGASGAITVGGTVTKDSDNYFITDKTTNVKYQLQGTGLDKWVKKSATISGSVVPNAPPAGGAAGIIAVSSSKKGIAAAAAGAGGAAAGAATAVGLSTAAIAGIAVAGATAGIVGGLAAAGTFSSSSASNP